MLSPRQCIFSYTIKVNLVRDIYTFGQSLRKFALHPLIYTRAGFNVAQDTGKCKGTVGIGQRKTPPAKDGEGQAIYPSSITTQSQHMVSILSLVGGALFHAFSPHFSPKFPRRFLVFFLGHKSIAIGVHGFEPFLR